jgi:hypothetical protein
MAYKDELRLAFSGKEIALERIAIIESTTFNDETAEQFSRRRREKYQNLLDRSEEKVAEIKSRIAEDIGVKKIQLEEIKNEREQVNTRYKLGELSYEMHEKIESGIRRKFDKVKGEAEALQQLYGTSTSLEIGSRIAIDIDNDVDEFGNIIKRPGAQIPNVPNMPNIPNIPMPNIPTNFQMPDNISIQGMNLSTGNLLSLIGAIGGIIAIFLPWISIGIPYLGKETTSLYGFSGLIKTISQLSNAFDPGSVPAYVGALSHYWIILLLVMIVCVYFIIQGEKALGALVHIGGGALQGIGAVLFAVMFIGMVAEIESQIAAYDFGLGLTSMVSSMFQIGYGVYIALICALLLIIGGILEMGE